MIPVCRRGPQPCIIRCVAAVLAASCSWGWHAPDANAQVDPPTPNPGQKPGWELSGRAGAAALLQSRSIALEHVVKPSVALRLGTEIVPRLEVGGALSAVVTTDDNYGVWAGYAHGRYRLLGSEAWQWGLSLGVGLGHNAPILHDDLRADLPVLPYAMLSTDVLWSLGSNTWLGVELANEQLSVLHLGAALRWR